MGQFLKDSFRWLVGLQALETSLVQLQKDEKKLLMELQKLEVARGAIGIGDIFGLFSKTFNWLASGATDPRGGQRGYRPQRNLWFSFKSIQLGGQRGQSSQGGYKGQGSQGGYRHQHNDLPVLTIKCQNTKFNLPTLQSLNLADLLKKCTRQNVKEMHKTK